MSRLSDYLVIGRIVRPHGVRGEVKIEPLTDDPGRFRELKTCYLRRDGEYKPVAVRARVGNDVIASIEGVTDRSAAERLRGTEICVDRAHAAELPEGRYFIADLIGMRVSDDRGNCLGELIDVWQPGGNDVYVVRGEKTWYLPALKALLLDVDVRAGQMVVSAEKLAEVAYVED